MKYYSKLTLIFLLSWVTLSYGQNNLDETLKDYIQKVPKPKSVEAANGSSDSKQYYGQINWTTGTIDAEGVCYFRPSDMGDDYDANLCAAGAEADARANLLAIINKTKVYDTVTVSKYTEGEDVKHITQAIVEGSIRAYRIGTPIITHTNVKNRDIGKVVVTMRANIYGQGSILDFLDQARPDDTIFHPVTSQLNEPTKRKKYITLDDLTKTLTDSLQITPKINLSIPQSQSKTFSPGIVPRVKIIETDGSYQYIDVKKTFNINIDDTDVNQFYQSVKPFLSIFNSGKAVDAQITNNEIVVDLNKISGDAKDATTKTAFGNFLRKAGKIGLKVLPYLLKFGVL